MVRRCQRVRQNALHVQALVDLLWKRTPKSLPKNLARKGLPNGHQKGRQRRCRRVRKNEEGGRETHGGSRAGGCLESRDHDPKEADIFERRAVSAWQVGWVRRLSWVGLFVQ